MSLTKCFIVKEADALISRAVSASYNDIDGVSYNDAIRRTFASLNTEDIVNSEGIDIGGILLTDESKDFLIKEIAEAIEVRYDIDPKDIGYSSEEIFNSTRESMLLYINRKENEKENSKGLMSTDYDNEYADINDSYNTFTEEGGIHLIDDKDTNVSNSDIMKIYFDNKIGLYDEFVDTVKKDFTSYFLDQKNLTKSYGLNFSEDVAKEILTDFLSGDYTNDSTKNGYYMQILQQHFKVFANNEIGFIDIEGDIAFDDNYQLITDDISINNTATGNVTNHSESAKSGIGQNTKGLEFFITSTPKLMKIKELTPDEKITIFGTSDLTDRTYIDGTPVDPNGYIQNPRDGFLTMEDYNKIFDLLEGVRNQNDEDIIAVLENSGNNVAYSLFVRFLNPSEDAVTYMDSKMMMRKTYGLSAIHKAQNENHIRRANESITSDANNEAAKSILSSLKSMRRAKIIRNASKNRTYIASSFSTDVQFSMDIKSSLRSVYQDGKLKQGIKDNLSSDNNGRLLSITYRGVNGDIKIDIPIRIINQFNNSNRKGFFNIEDVKSNITVKSTDDVVTIKSLMIDLGFPPTVITDDFIYGLANQESDVSKGPLATMLAQALYSIHLNKEMDNTAEFEEATDTSMLNKDLIIIDSDAKAIYDHANLMHDYIDVITTYLSEYGGVNDKQTLVMNDGNTTASITQGDSLNIEERIKEDHIIFKNLLYSETGDYQYLENAKFNFTSINGENVQFRDMSENQKRTYFIEKEFLGKLSAQEGVMGIFAYATERKNPEIHYVKSENALKLNGNKIDENYYFEAIAENRKNIINATSDLLVEKYRNVFDIDNSHTRAVLAELDIHPDKISDISDALNVANIKGLNVVIKRLDEILGVDKATIEKLLQRSQLVRGFHYDTAKLGLRDSMITHFNIYNDTEKGKLFAKKDFGVMLTVLNDYEASEFALEDIKKISKLETNDKKVLTNVIKKAYLLNNLLHQDALQHLTSGSLFQFKSDIKESKKDTIRKSIKANYETRNALAKEANVKINEYNKGKEDSLTLPREKIFLNDEIENEINEAIYFESLNISVVDRVKRLGLMTTSGISPVTKETGSEGMGVSDSVFIGIVDDHMVTPDLIGNKNKKQFEGDDAQTKGNPLFIENLKLSMGGRFDGLTQGDNAIKSGINSFNPDDGTFDIQKETLANIFNNTGAVVFDTDLLRKMNTAVDFSEDGEPVKIKVPVVDSFIDENGRAIAKISYNKNSSKQSSFANTTVHSFHNVQELYDYLGGYNTAIGNVHGIVANILALPENAEYSNRYVAMVTPPSARKTGISSLNDTDVATNNSKRLHVREQKMHDFRVLLSKNKDNEKEVKLAIQLMGVMSSSYSINEGHNILNAMNSMGNAGYDVLSGDLAIIASSIIEDTNVSSDTVNVMKDLLAKSDGRYLFEVVEEMLKDNNPYIVDAVKTLYNRYLTKLAQENIDSDRNSDEVIGLLKGIESNFNAAQLRTVSEGILRSNFFKLSLGIKTKGTETIMTSGAGVLKLRKNSKGDYVTAIDNDKYVEVKDISGIYDFDADIIVIHKGKQVSGNIKTILSALNYNLESLFKNDDSKVYVQDRPIYKTYKEISGIQLSVLPRHTVIRVNGDYKFIKDISINEDSLYEVVLYNRIDKDTVIDTNDIVTFYLDDIQINEESIKEDDFMDADFVVFDTGMLVRKSELDNPYFMEANGLTKDDVRGYVELITERELNYYQFVNEKKDNVNDTDQVLSLEFFENSGFINGNNDRDQKRRDINIALEKEGQRRHNDIPRLAFDVITNKIKSDFIGDPKGMEDAYNKYKNSSIEDKYILEDEFTDYLSDFGVGESNQKELNIIRKKESLRSFFRGQVNAILKKDKYKVIVPEIITPSFHYKSFGIPKGSTVHEIQKDKEAFFRKNTNKKDVRHGEMYTLKSKFYIKRTISKLEKILVSSNDVDAEVLLDKYNQTLAKIEEIESSGAPESDIANEISSIIVSSNYDLDILLNEKIAEIVRNRVDNFDATLDVIVTRIPLQAKQSTGYSKIKEFYWGSDNTIFVSMDHYLVTGADNDGDTTNMMVYSFDDKNVLVSYDDYIDVDDSGKQTVPGFEVDDFLTTLNTFDKEDKEGRARFIESLMTNTRESNTKLDTILQKKEALIREGFTEQGTDMYKAINRMRKFEVSKFNDGMRNFIIDQIKKAYQDINGVFEIQSPMSSVITQALSGNEIKERYANDDRTNASDGTRLSVIDNIKNRQDVDEGATALGTTVNAGSLSGLLSLVSSDKMLKTTLRVSIMNKDGEEEVIESNGGFDSEVIAKDKLASNNFKLSFTRDDVKEPLETLEEDC